MKRAVFTVLGNERISADVFDLRLSGDTSELVGSGQFVNADIPDLYLRRPISICDYSPGEMRLVIKIVGKGTQKMASLKEGDPVDLLVPLGNGFDTAKSGKTPYLFGGGVGVAPMVRLAKDLIGQGKKTTVVLGFNSSSDVILYDDYCRIVGKENVFVTTVDGSFGQKGFVTEVNADGASFVYSCGPLPMMKALDKAIECGAEYSFESRMGCGFGACMGCTLASAGGPVRVCREGPVFRKGEILWQT